MYLYHIHLNESKEVREIREDIYRKTVSKAMELNIEIPTPVTLSFVQTVLNSVMDLKDKEKHLLWWEDVSFWVNRLIQENGHSYY